MVNKGGSVVSTRFSRKLLQCKKILVGGFKYFLFSPLFGEGSHFDEHIFQRG